MKIDFYKKSSLKEDILLKKPQKPKEVLLFVDGSSKEIQYVKNTVFIDGKGNFWSSMTHSKNDVYSLVGFCYERRSKNRLKLKKVMDYWI